MKKKQKPIYIILGTRAQIIKMAPIMTMLEKERIEYELINSEQHVENMNILLQEFGIKTKLRQIINNKNEAKSMDLFGKWMLKIFLLTINPFSIRKIFNQGRGIVLTHGDTATTAWAAIYGKLCLNKVMHIEAGMRSHDIFKPFPEEILRRITGLFSNYHMCPDDVAIANLRRYPGKKYNTGANTLYDAVILATKTIESESKYYSKFIKELSLPAKFGLVSVHRYENIFIKETLEQIVSLINTAADKLPLVFILHPSTENQLKTFGFFEKWETNKNIKFITRLNFIDFIALSMKCEFILTDSGGNQQEMSYLGTPTLLLRGVTESIEGMGENILLSNYDEEVLVNFIDNYKFYKKSVKNIASPTESVKLVILDYLND